MQLFPAHRLHYIVERKNKNLSRVTPTGYLEHFQSVVTKNARGSQEIYNPFNVRLPSEPIPFPTIISCAWLKCGFPSQEEFLLFSLPSFLLHNSFFIISGLPSVESLMISDFSTGD